MTKITLYGTEDLVFMADEATDNVHLGEEDVSAKAFVVAGGKSILCGLALLYLLDECAYQ